jgi:hypothetical protein
MAAARRSSDSGLIVALVIFVILWVACLGGAIWFWQQFEKVKTGSDRVQADFDGKVADFFAAQGWELDDQSPDEWGIRYVGESFDDVVLRLEDAAEHEELMDSVLGWQSVETARQALAEDDLQAVAAESGDGEFRTIMDLLEGYGSEYKSLTDDVQRLQASNDSLVAERDSIRTRSQEDLADLQAENTKIVADYGKRAGDLEATNANLNNRVTELTAEVQNWRRRHQQEVDARRRDATDLKAEVDKWREMYEEAVAGPGEREVLVADGEVLEVNGQFDFVVIEGGENEEVKANDVFVVYSVLPDGSHRKKGVLLVGEVMPVTSVATIASQEEDSYIVKGDNVVSQDRWFQFYREQQAEAGAGG